MSDELTKRGAAAKSTPAVRLVCALFLMGFGYALLSFCLFRMMAFTVTGPAFFMLYVCVGMPLGAYIAKLRQRSSTRDLALAIRFLVGLAVVFPLICWFVPRGPDLLTSAWRSGRMGLPAFTKHIIYEVLVTAPLFLLWGLAEFTGYEVALGSRRLRKGFYLIFVWALACAHAVGSFAVPRWGWLRTVYLVPCVAMLAYVCLVGVSKAGRLRMGVSVVAALLIWLAAGTQENRYAMAVLPDGLLRIRSALDGKDCLTGEPLQPPANSSVITQRWGKYCHFALLRYEKQGITRTLGYYDGACIWTVRPDRIYSEFLEAFIFDLIPEGADICILGAGGGRQVGMALQRKPRSIVAVDIIPEVFSLLGEEYSWANGDLYTSPLVETVAGDGRNYVKDCNRKFDFILLPHTESFAAILKTFFEPGQSIHTVEAFTVMKEHLKPGGIIAVLKGVDRNEGLLNSYAKTLKAAGLHVIGWGKPVAPPLNMESFILLASHGPIRASVSPAVQKSLISDSWEFRDFQKVSPRGQVIYDDSALISGVAGRFFRPESMRNWMLAVTAFAAILVCGIMILTLRKSKSPPAESRGRTALFVLAGVAIGLNAVYIENAMIFWMARDLFNSLSAFFVGAIVFLLLWGLSSLGMRRWGLLILLGAVGFLLAKSSGHWTSGLGFASLCLMALGSGLLFPLLGLAYRSRLLNLFAADAVGGMVGALLGIWLSFLYGFKTYFDLAPWVWAVTVVIVVLATGRVDLEQPGSPDQ